MSAFSSSMNRKGTLLKEQKVLVFLTFVAGTVCCTSAYGQNAQSLFQEKCAGCHSIGGGTRVGPDLADTKKWSTIELTKAIKRMEDNTGHLSDSDVDGLIKFLKAAKPTTADVSLSSVVSPVKGEGVADSKAVSDAQNEVGSVDKGKAIFDGDSALKNGGLSCISCHSIAGSGGNMGPDLTGIAAKMQASALVAACEHTPYKVMNAAYKEHAVTHEEALDLQAYLSSLNTHGKSKQSPVSLIALVFSLFVLGLIALAYRGKPKSARSKLTERT